MLIKIADTCKHWCPLKRDTIEDRCEGHHCMAWRWAQEQNSMSEAEGSAKLGFCGLAGKP